MAVISDGTRVLGMGDIGPKAGLPVMEGKSLLYKYLGGVDGFPLMVDTKDPDKFIEFVKLVQPGLGGVNLEDIAQPKCFRILDTLREECEIPVWHDDQQGTACVTLAGLINALKVVGRRIDDVKIAFIGSGAANVAISRLIFSYGADPAKCRIVDSKGILHKGRSDIEAVKAEWVDKWKYCQITNAEQPHRQHRRGAQGRGRVHRPQQAGPRHHREGLDQGRWPPTRSSSSAPTPSPRCGPGTPRRPAPPWWPPAAATSPTRSTTRSASPASSAARSTCAPRRSPTRCASPRPWSSPRWPRTRASAADYIMPTMDDWEVFPREAAAVAMKAIEQGIALRTDLTFEQEVAEATAIIARARGMVQDEMAVGYIPMPEGSRAPAPTRAAMKAAARGAGDYAGEMVDKAVDAIGPAAQKVARRGRRPTRRRRDQEGHRAQKKDDGVTDAEVVDEEPPAWKPPAAEPSLRRRGRRRAEPPAGDEEGRVAKRRGGSSGRPARGSSS